MFVIKAIGGILFALLLLLWKLLDAVSGLAGIICHLTTTAIAYEYSGGVAAAITFCTPFVSEIYWMYQLYSSGQPGVAAITFFATIWAIPMIIPVFFMALTAFPERKS